MPSQNKHWRVHGRCPHCGRKNMVIVNLPRSLDKVLITKSKCWDAEIQRGCLEEFEVHQEVAITIHKTDEQIKAEFEAKKEYENQTEPQAEV